jgi:hypothetical protein
VIGQHEAFTALSTAKNEAYRQAIDGGTIPASAVTKKWRHFPIEHPRVQHVAMNGKSVGFNQPFILPDGTSMMFPHDPSAPPSQTLFCRCQADMVVDFLQDVQ